MLSQLAVPAGFHRLVGHAGEGHAGGQHQPLLAAAHHHVDAPFVHPQVDAGQRGDGVHQQQRRVLRRVQRRAHLVQRQEHAGGGLVVDGADRLDLMRRVGFEQGLQRGHVDAHAPVAPKGAHVQPEVQRHAAPRLGEIAGLQDQHGVAGRQHVD